MRRAARCDTAGREAGFTILEVLVALAVVAIVLSAIGAVTAATTRGVRSIEQHVVMVETARTVAAELRSRDALKREELAGELFGSRWRIDVSPIIDSDIALSPQSQWIPQVVTVRV